MVVRVAASLDRIVLLLTNGMSVEAAESYCLKQGSDPDAAKRLVADARRPQPRLEPATQPARHDPEACAEFFGLKAVAPADRIVFLADCSGSMFKHFDSVKAVRTDRGRNRFSQRSAQGSQWG